MVRRIDHSLKKKEKKNFFWMKSTVIKIKMSKKRNDLWIDSESDSSIEELSKENCSCLICSILPALSNRNCCSKHLTALMIPPGRKHRYYEHSKKLRPVILTAFVRPIFHSKLFLLFFSRIKTIVYFLRISEWITTRAKSKIFSLII